MAIGTKFILDKGPSIAPSPATVPSYLNPNVNIPTTTAGETNRFQNLQGSQKPVDKAPNTSRAAAIAGGLNGGNRSSTSGSGSNLKVSGSNLAPGTTSTGALVPQNTTEIWDVLAARDSNTNTDGSNTDGSNGGGGGGNDGGGSTTTTTTTTPAPEEAAASGMSQAEYDQMLQSAINDLLNPEFIGFQGDRAAELRRLQNYKNQLYGNAELGLIGSVDRQQTTDKEARRRLAAQRASAGMLQGGAYAGTERGLGGLQEQAQAYALQELQRPYQEQVASDRLNEFGLTYDPTGREFDLYDFNSPDNLMSGWASNTFEGRQAAANARLQAIQQLLAQGITI